MNSFETWGSTLLPTIELLATLAFALSGIMEAASKRMDVVGVCVVGFLAAFGGGTLRDIVCNEIPVSFKDHRPYALCSVAGGVVYIVLDALNSEPWFCMALCALVTVIIRTLAIWNYWVLPAWRKD